MSVWTQLSQKYILGPLIKNTKGKTLQVWIKQVDDGAVEILAHT